MQVRSIEHLQNWLKRDPKLSNELLIKPLDVGLAQLQRSLQENTDRSKSWWKADVADDVDGENNSDDELGSQWKKPTDWKGGSKASNQVQAVAKKHHMVTDVKKAVFQAIV